MKKKKVVRRVVVALLVVVVAAILAVILFLNQLVQRVVEHGGSSVLGVTTTLEDVDLRPLRGTLHLQNLTIGSPTGFKSNHAFRFDSLSVDLDTATVLDDTIVIREVVIDSPEIVYELGLTGSNLGQLLENIEERSGATDAADPSDPDAEPARKVIIDRLTIKNGSIRIASKMRSGPGLTLPLPAIQLTDIGRQEQGASPPVVVARVFKAIVTTVLQTVASSAQLIGTGLKAGAEAALKGVELGAGLAGEGARLAVEAADSATEAVGKGLKGAGSAAGQAGAAVGDSVGDSVGAAAKGVGTVAGSAARGVSEAAGAAGKAVGGLTGLFKRDPTNAPPESATPSISTAPAAP